MFETKNWKFGTNPAPAAGSPAGSKPPGIAEMSRLYGVSSGTAARAVELYGVSSGTAARAVAIPRQGRPTRRRKGRRPRRTGSFASGVSESSLRLCFRGENGVLPGNIGAAGGKCPAAPGPSHGESLQFVQKFIDFQRLRNVSVHARL